MKRKKLPANHRAVARALKVVEWAPRSKRKRRKLAEELLFELRLRGHRIVTFPVTDKMRKNMKRWKAARNARVATMTQKGPTDE